MAGPFPGMDPWLENRILWQGFHNVYIAQCMTALNRILPAELVATTELRIQLTEPNQARPDVGIVPRFALSPNPTPPVSTRVALAEPPAVEPLTIRALPEEERQAYITIREALHQDRVITIIELLSLSNKRGRGYDEYRAKQAELLQSETSLVEIDLLRGGEHTIALPLSALRDRGAVWEYLVCIHDIAHRWDFRVWPISLSQRLPEIPIPLGAGYDPVSLDLQVLLNECYETGRYGSLLRYTEPPEVALADEWATWAASTVAAT